MYLEKLQELFTCPLHSEAVGQNEHHLVGAFHDKKARGQACQTGFVAGDVVRRWSSYNGAPGAARIGIVVWPSVVSEQKSLVRVPPISVYNKGTYPFYAKTIGQSVQGSSASARGGEIFYPERVVAIDRTACTLLSAGDAHTCVAVSLPMFILSVPGTVLRAIVCLRFISENGRKAAKMSIPGRAFLRRCISSQLPVAQAVESIKHVAATMTTTTTTFVASAWVRRGESSVAPRVRGIHCMCSLIVLSVFIDDAQTFKNINVYCVAMVVLFNSLYRYASLLRSRPIRTTNS